MKTNLKIGILGMGSIGQRHAKNLLELGHELLTYDAVTISKWSKNRDTVLDESDAIVIATPIKQHYADIFDAIERKKPIFCEKPIALIGHPGMHRVEMVGYNLRFHPCVIAAEEWMDELGHIWWADFVCAQANNKYNDDVLLNWSHEVDLAMHLLGYPVHSDVKVIRDTDRGNINVLARMQLTMQFPDRNSAHHVGIHLDYLTQPEVRQFIIVGVKGQIVVDLKNRMGWLRGTDGGVIDSIDASDSSFDDDYMDEMKEFIGLVQGDRPYNRGATGQEALEVLELCNAMRMKSLQVSGGRVQ